MQQSATGSSKVWRGRASAAALAAILLASGALAGLPPASAISPPTIDPGAVPPDGPPGPPAPMKQNSYCTEVGVLPGTDFRLQPKYMDMLNLQEAWQFGRGAGVKVAVIDTGVSPHPRFPHLIPGGDYVMGGDGLSDCDAHGTIVASMIGAAPANGAGVPPAAPRRPVTIPTTEPPPKAPPPQTVTLSPLPQTVTMVPPPPQDQPAPGPFGAPPAPAPPAAPPPGNGPPPGPAQPGQAPAAGHGGGTVTIPSYSGGSHVVGVDYPRPLDPPPPPPPAPPAPSAGPDAFSGVAPDVDIIAIRQSSQAFGLKDAYTGDEDPQTRAKIDGVQTMARAIVHAANMGAQVINISDVTCMSARNIVDQRALGAAVRYAAVDKNAVIVAAAGDTNKKDCKQNPPHDPLQPNDPRNWNSVTTVVTPSWFSDYVLTVGAVDEDGRPQTGGQGQGSTSVAGPWVGIAAPGTDVVGLSPRDDGVINAIDGPDNTLLVPSGTSFSAAIVSGIAALVRAKFPQLSAYQVINRLTRTARAPARGVDNQIGHGIVDPVAALTWDVPEGPLKPPQQLSAPLNIPRPAPHRDMVPVWVAGGGLLAALLIGGGVFGTAMLMKRSRKQQ
ncbi:MULTISPECIES: type VII secretion-associated serine protease mycosin [unclassified Mycobacterium]|uniref:type VII secretion-associated serine protease mycosin n=2 Tax=Mycobacterium TaxID=1763 RepID=UPI0007FE1D80|nr:MULTISPECIES: type VII secretion-associated serine protease mycosin [unclassified Mycobacterium]OBG54376.1 peptidase S8 [Mycobacterium sp. E735]OBG65343.1 peptidase S8 [Mycobacterium sp. E188]OBG73298.1 peptidase S8 [Mycobacterium sp. E3305]OBH39940.1 peptidase S8 [Mycobacterium sp. E183]